MFVYKHIGIIKNSWQNYALINSSTTWILSASPKMMEGRPHFKNHCCCNFNAHSKDMCTLPDFYQLKTLIMQKVIIFINYLQQQTFLLAGECIKLHFFDFRLWFLWSLTFNVMIYHLRWAILALKTTSISILLPFKRQPIYNRILNFLYKIW